MASARHPWRTITGWVVALVALLFLAASGGGTFTEDFCREGQPERAGPAAPRRELPRGGQGPGPGRLRGRGRHDPRRAQRANVESVLSDVAGLEHVESVTDPFTAGTVSADGRIGYAELTLDVPEREMGKPAFTVLSDAVSGTHVLRGARRARRRRPSSSTPRTRAAATSGSVCWSPCSSCSSCSAPSWRPSSRSGSRSSRSAPASAASRCWPAAWTCRPPRSRSPAWSASASASTTRCSWWLATARTAPRGRTTTWRSPGPWAPRVLPSSSPAAPSCIATAALAITGLGVLTSIGLATALMVLFAVAAAITLLPALLEPAGRPHRQGAPGAPPPPGQARRGQRLVALRPPRRRAGPGRTCSARSSPCSRSRPRPCALQTAFPAAGDAPAETTHTAGLRPALRGLRRRDQRTAPGRRRPRTDGVGAAGVPP